MTLRRRNSFNPYDSPNSDGSPELKPDKPALNISVTNLEATSIHNDEPEVGQLEPFPSTPAEDCEEVETEEEVSDVEPDENPMWDYLISELQVNEYDINYEIKLERVKNFFKVPKYIEKLMIFGICICLNTLLFIFTILPLRVFLTFIQIFNPLTNRKLNTIQKLDIIKFSLILFTSILLIKIDASKIYHSVRNQSFIKLYVILNMSEIFDKLLCSFGQDILDSFFAEVTLGKINKIGWKLINRFLISIVYIFSHSLVLCCQMICLNVAINSHNYSLLSLLLSNQFVEIKSTVFKRWERENLFQVCCGDMVERFQISIFLTIIMVRNFLELWGSWIAFNKLGDFKLTLIWELIPTNLDAISNLIIIPILIVLIGETLVDWLKHAFITKFNHIRPTVYERYIDILCKDLIPTIPNRLSNKGKPNFLMDQSSVVARRIGFAVFPISCLIIRIGIQILGQLNLINFDYSKFFNYILNFNFNKFTLDKLILKNLELLPIIVVGILIYLLLLSLKLIIGIKLMRFGLNRYYKMLDREKLDQELAIRDKQLGEKDYNDIKSKLKKYPEDLYKANNLDLNNVERYSLFKSRIP